MHRTALLNMLTAYRDRNPEEFHVVDRFLDFVSNNPDCFERSLLEGHVTGSAWIVDPGFTHTLLIHHRKLDRWMQPGGHCDGDPDVLAVALKETSEETGLDAKPGNREIFDIDIHTIPQRKDVPEHLHYDVRFLLVAGKTQDELPANSETHAVKWVSLEEVDLFSAEPSVLRMRSKTPKPISA